MTHLRIAVPRCEIPLKTVCKQGNAPGGHVPHADGVDLIGLLSFTVQIQRKASTQIMRVGNTMLVATIMKENADPHPLLGLMIISN